MLYERTFCYSRAFARQGIDLLKIFREGVEHASIESLGLLERAPELALSEKAEEELARTGLFQAVSESELADNEELTASQIFNGDLAGSGLQPVVEAPNGNNGGSREPEPVQSAPADHVPADTQASDMRVGPSPAKTPAPSTVREMILPQEPATPVPLAADDDAPPPSRAVMQEDSASGPAPTPRSAFVAAPVPNRTGGDHADALLAQAQRVAQFPHGPFRPGDPQMVAISTGLLSGQLPRDNVSALVTSLTYNDGKTALATGLALELARRSHLRVCLIDTDLNRPMVGAMLELTPQYDLLDALSGQCDIGQAITLSAGDNLAVLPNPGMEGGGADILAADEMREILAVLRRHFDILILDGPPTRLPGDCFAIAPQTGGVLVAVRGGDTPLDELAHARRGLVASRARIVGTVMTYV